MRLESFGIAFFFGKKLFPELASLRIGTQLSVSICELRVEEVLTRPVIVCTANEVTIGTAIKA